MTLRTVLVLLVLACPANLSAGPVVLNTSDGGIIIEGDLVSRDGEFFRVETAFGPLTVDGGNLICSGVGCPDPDELVVHARIGGPTDMIHRLMPPLLEVFAEREGYNYLRQFTDDETVSWKLTDPQTGRLVADFEGRVEAEEKALVQLAAREFDLSLGRISAEEGIRQDVIALDALVPIVAPENPRAMITVSQLVAVLQGRTESWASLGGSDLPIEVHLPEKLDEIRGLGPDIVFGEAVWHGDARNLADAVAADPGALGIVPFSMIGNAVPLVISGPCGLATPATRDTIRAEDFPLTEPLFLQRVGARQPRIIRDFIAFTRSYEAQPVIRKAGYVDQAIGRIGFERQGDRLANAVLSAGEDPAAIHIVQQMIGALMTNDRLTLTFRFQDGSSELDPQSASNVRRLADAIARGDFDGRRLIFVGFSDGAGPAEGNVRLSARRARSVRRAVAALAGDAPVEFGVQAYGEAMPMACDDTAWGRQINRRVEVWLDGKR